jgi:hypothetical protein
VNFTVHSNGQGERHNEHTYREHGQVVHYATLTEDVDPATKPSTRLRRKAKTSPRKISEQVVPSHALNMNMKQNSFF